MRTSAVNIRFSAAVSASHHHQRANRYQFPFDSRLYDTVVTMRWLCPTLHPAEASATVLVPGISLGDSESYFPPIHIQLIYRLARSLYLLSRRKNACLQLQKPIYPSS